MSLAKELILSENKKGNASGHRDALQAIEIAYGQGHVFQYDIGDYSTNEWENGRGKGTDSDKYTRKDREYSTRDALTDDEVLKRAAEDVKIDNLTEAEKDALDIFKKRLREASGPPFYLSQFYRNL